MTKPRFVRGGHTNEFTWKTFPSGCRAERKEEGWKRAKRKKGRKAACNRGSTRGEEVFRGAEVNYGESRAKREGHTRISAEGQHRRDFCMSGQRELTRDDKRSSGSTGSKFPVGLLSLPPTTFVTSVRQEIFCIVRRFYPGACIINNASFETIYYFK